MSGLDALVAAAPGNGLHSYRTIGGALETLLARAGTGARGAVRLAVVGGGPVGVEFAQAFSRLGVRGRRSCAFLSSNSRGHASLSLSSSELGCVEETFECVVRSK